MFSRFFPKKELKKKTPRAARVYLSPLHRISFEFEEPHFRDPVEISNLSTTGIGFLRDSHKWPDEGSLLKGTLVLGNRVFALTLQLVYVSKQVSGVRFVSPSAASDAGLELFHAISDYLGAEITALNLNKVPESSLEPVPDGDPHWFSGENNTELFYVEKEGVVQHFHFVFLGIYVEGALDQKARVGSLIDDPFPSKTQIKSSTMIRLNPDWDPALREASLRFIAHVSELPEEHRQQILSSLRGEAKGE